MPLRHVRNCYKNQWLLNNLFRSVLVKAMERMVKVSVSVAIICAVPIFGTEEIVRNTEYGKVRGILSAEGQSYLGIPYGTAERFVRFFFLKKIFFTCKLRIRLNKNLRFFNVVYIFWMILWNEKRKYNFWKIILVFFIKYSYALTDK